MPNYENMSPEQLTACAEVLDEMFWALNNGGEGTVADILFKIERDMITVDECTHTYNQRQSAIALKEV